MTKEDGQPKPTAIFLTRYLPHFRREVFKRVTTTASDFDLTFVHTSKVPSGLTGVSCDQMPNSLPVKMYRVGPFFAQPSAIRYVWSKNPDVLVCETTITSLAFYVCGALQYLRGKGVVHWSKGPSPNDHGSLRRKLNDLWFRIYSAVANVLIGYGDSSRKWFVEHGWSADRIVIAQNTVDTTSLMADADDWRHQGLLMRQRLGLEDAFVLGIVSRHIAKKRIDLLIEAGSQLADHIPELVVLIGGSGPESDNLRALAAKKSVRVEFLGPVPIGEDNVVMSASDVNVFPGAVGLAIVQSMALAKPTVIADEPFADAELITHERTGLRFACGDAPALAAQIRRLFEDSQLRTSLGAAAKELVSQKATIQNMVDRIVQAVRLSFETRRNKKRRKNPR